MIEDNGADAQSDIEYVTVTIGSQLFGLPISRVHDVFFPERLTRVPLAAPEIAGVLNLRGRIVTTINMRIILGLPISVEDRPAMAVGIESKGEAFGLLVEGVGEVIRLASSNLEPVPANLDPRWTHIACGVHRLDGQLLVVLDTDRLLGIEHEAVAA